MADAELRFRVSLDDEAGAQALAASVAQTGASATVTEEKGLLPLAVILAIVIPPGIGVLALVIDHIVHGWKDCGILIDARGTGAPIISKDAALPYGTVIILTRDGDTAKRTDLRPMDDLTKYIAAAVKAVAGGASATAAKKAADAVATA
jgi:hypothetical protein